jgi:hAT family C-terminal dimerisation region
MINARGFVKDHLWIMQQCKDVIADLGTISEHTSVIGFVMDSASANRRAYQEMHKECEEHKKLQASRDDHPTESSSEDAADTSLGPLILLQCASHTLSLLIKDITVRFGWVKEVYDSAISISKAVNNTERINDQYIRACQDLNVKPTVLQSHVETRFGSYHFVLRSILDVIAPLKSMCNSDEFEALAKTCSPARKLIDIVTPSKEKSFRQHAPFVIELIDPIMEALHRVEADQPLLSSMMSVVSGLFEHADDFSKKHPALASTHGVAELADVEYDSSDDELSLESGLLEVFKSRLTDFYMKDCMYAAYMLDPANFVTSNKGLTYQLPWETLSDEEMTRFTDEVERLGGEPALEHLQTVRSKGISFKNKLDQLNAKKCVAAMCAAAGEVANIRAIVHRRDLWTSALASGFPELSVVAAKLLSMPVTSCASERNLSKFGRLYDKLRGRLRIEAADKMVFVSQNKRAAVVEGLDEEVLVASIEETVLSDANADQEAVELSD